MDPVVIVGPLSSDEDDPVVVRVENVNATGFDIHTQEWDYLDGIHIKETVGYMVIERGVHILSDGTMIEARTFDTGMMGSFELVNFNETFNQIPVVITTILSCNEADAVTTRMKNISINGFEFCMQEQESNENNHVTETISYIAWEPSSGITSGLTFNVSKTDNIVTHAWHNIVYNEAFLNYPIFLGGIQTTDGGDTVNLRWQNNTKTGINIKLSEEQSHDSEISHTTEVVGCIAISY